MNHDTHAPSRATAGSRQPELDPAAPSPSVPPVSGPALPAAEEQLLRQLREGDPEAGRRFVRDNYAGVYRYLLYLSGRREIAEDLTQETFLQAWRRLETFAGRAPLSLWLHRIAHREFLQAVRHQRPETSLEVVAETAAPYSADCTEAVELWDAIRKLPADEGEVVVLHYLHGYDCAEIAQIVRTHVSTVKYRLTLARAHLQRELGEGDLTYLNGQGGAMRQWAWLPLEALAALEARLSLQGVATESKEGETVMSERTPGGLSRRRLLAAAGTAAAASLSGGERAAATQNEFEIVDDRLTRKVTLGAKATALSDLCEQLKAETNIPLSAGPSVADEKVTLFCEKLPLREVMRQLSRPFGYTWLRSGNPGKYRYELVQDLRSQLLEEELRNRDRNAALLALDDEIERYRPYLNLSPDEALARAREASAAEKPLLERFAGYAWGAIQMYSRLSTQERTRLSAGQSVVFSAVPRSGEQPLPDDIARHAMQVFRDWYVYPRGDGYSSGPEEDKTVPGAVAASSLPDARARIKLTIVQSELGRTALLPETGWFVLDPGGRQRGGGNWASYVATGMSHTALEPRNALVNSRLAHDPALQGRISVEPVPSCPGHGRKVDGKDSGEASLSMAAAQDKRQPKVSSDDVLEALHRSSGLPVVADFYTRLHPLPAVSVKGRPLFEALNQVADAMRLRWHREVGAGEGGSARGGGTWVQFRSMCFYDDRLKEVPHRLLARWAAAREKQGTLSLDDLVEIAQLPDTQLDASDMAEGARECFGLTEWDLARSSNHRPYLRYLAGFTPAQRQMAMSPGGLLFPQMSLAQQQSFMSLALPANGEPLQSFEELAGAALRVEYTQPGWFQWGETRERNILRWVVPMEPGTHGLRVLRPPVRARTREAVLQAVRQIDPPIREALLRAMRRIDPRLEAAPHVVEEDQIFPTRLDLAFVYFPGARNGRAIRVRESDSCDDYPVSYKE